MTVFNIYDGMRPITPLERVALNCQRLRSLASTGRASTDIEEIVDLIQESLEAIAEQLKELKHADPRSS